MTAASSSVTDETLRACLAGFLSGLTGSDEQVSVKAARQYAAQVLQVEFDTKSERRRVKTLLSDILLQQQDAEVTSAVPASGGGDGDDAEEAPTEWTEETLAAAAKKRKYHTLSPTLSAVCGNRAVASHTQVVKYVWEYIKEKGLKGAAGVVVLDDLLAAVADVGPGEPREMSSKRVSGILKKHYSEYTGEPPEEEVEVLRAGKPRKAAGGKKRPREVPAAAAAAGAGAGAAVVLPAGMTLVKKPRKAKFVQRSPALQALAEAVHPEGTDGNVTTRQQAISDIWAYARAEQLQVPGDGQKFYVRGLLKPLFPDMDGGVMRMQALMAAMSSSLLPYDGPAPAKAVAEFEAKLAAFEAQTAELVALGVDPTAARRAKKPRRGGKEPLVQKMRTRMFALDDALTALTGLRIASGATLILRLSEYVKEHKLEEGGTITPNAELSALMGHSKKGPWQSLWAALEGRLTPFPGTMKKAMEVGAVHAADFAGTPLEAKARAAFEAATQQDPLAGMAAGASSEDGEEEEEEEEGEGEEGGEGEDVSLEKLLGE